MDFQVGSDVESMCNTCGDVWHVIVAKVGEKITKVECKQCSKQHRFKPTGAAPEANLKTTRRKVETKKKEPSGKPKIATGGAPYDPSKPSRPYAMSARFALGEQIQHKKFGPGVVSAVEDEKIHVRFEAGAKILRHSRTG